MLRPVNKLPPEILSHIARYLLNEKDEDALRIVPLTHVCRYWRESIISSPEHWTLISSRDDGLATESLERAKAAPLKICLDMEIIQEQSSPGFWHDIIKPYIQNAETLVVISIATSEEFTEMFPNFPKSMPNLRRLKLEMWEDCWDPSVDVFESPAHTLEDLSLIDIPLSPSLLKLRTLTALTLHHDSYHHNQFNLHLDTLLNFLEENRSLTSANLRIGFTERSSQRQPMKGNQLQYLSIDCGDAMDTQALISNIPLQRGAHLKILSHTNTELNEILSGIPTTHLLNLLSPTLMRYSSCIGETRLDGPNGTFSFDCYRPRGPLIDFGDFPLSPLTTIQEFHLIHREASWMAAPNSVEFCLSSFPVLETLAVSCDTGMAHLLSPLLSNPSSSPSLKTLAFLDCDLSEDFMKELSRFASDRKNTTSAWLHRILIVHQDGIFPSAASLHSLRGHIRIVDLRMADKLPKDLT